jgi:hypothetical protein
MITLEGRDSPDNGAMTSRNGVQSLTPPSNALTAPTGTSSRQYTEKPGAGGRISGRAPNDKCNTGMGALMSERGLIPVSRRHNFALVNARLTSQPGGCITSFPFLRYFFARLRITNIYRLFDV